MTGRAGKRKGFSWIVPHLREHPIFIHDSQLFTWARTSGTKNAKRRDNRRERSRARREARNAEREG